MARISVKYNLETGQILEVVEVSIDSDLELNIDYGQGMIEISPNHPVLSEQKNWYIELAPDRFGGLLKRKSQVEIDERDRKEKELKTKLETFEQKTRNIETEILLELINELRPGKPPLSIENIKIRKDNKIKAIRNELGLKEEDERFIR